MLPRFLVGDPLRLGQILINLINNAVKFTDQGEIVVRVMVTEHPLLDAEAQNSESTLLKFSVSDTGIGYDAARKWQTCFKPFNQADTSVTRKYGGTGLGLAISKQLAELDGWNDLAGERTRRRKHVLLYDSYSASLPKSSRSELRASLSDLQQKSVLVVDDSSTARHSLVGMLRANGLESSSGCVWRGGS